MPEITLLSKETIDKIAAGEVVERPSSVVKELVENAMDSGATAVTVEIKDGGTTMIRITDNGCGIKKEQVELAFLRHSTSKIRSIEDLLSIHSLGFRGEALSSISAVSQVELITKTPASLTGTRFLIEGSEKKGLEEIGAPDGTTILVRNLFFNTPARQKYLKTAQTEGSYINSLMEHLALSHPEISFQFISNNQKKLHTSGNGNQKEIIYHLFGRDITSQLMEVDFSGSSFQVKGFIGKPVISRGNRNYEYYFINSRYIRSSLIAKSVEDSYKNLLMQHQYPFCVLNFEFQQEKLDVNVHPSKMELRFEDGPLIYEELKKGLTDRLYRQEYIQDIPLETEKKAAPAEKMQSKLLSERPQPFEKERVRQIAETIQKDSPYQRQYRSFPVVEEHLVKEPVETPQEQISETVPVVYEQQKLAMEEGFLAESSLQKHRIIGQLFDTYWLVEFDDKLFIVDQHAAHEKVLYERNMASIRNRSFTSQIISPPIILTLDDAETENLTRIREYLEMIGYEIEHFGGKEYSIRTVPDNLYGLDSKGILLEILDTTNEFRINTSPDIILEKLASVSCKAAVKGNQQLSTKEMESLIHDLMALENPYFCPHGRPTIISFSKYELEKKFKRIV